MLDLVDTLGMVLKSGLDKGNKKRVRLVHRAGVFGMELGPDEPGMAWQFNHFNQIKFRIKATHPQTCVGQLFSELVVQFKTMPMPFVDGFGFAINLGGQSPCGKSAGVGPKSHGPPFVRDFKLAVHEVYHGVSGSGIHLG